MVRQHDDKGESKHSDAHQHGPGIRGRPLMHLVLYIEFIGSTLPVKLVRLLIVRPDIGKHPVIGIDHGLAHPDQGDEKHKREQHYPDDDGRPKALILVPAEYVAEKDKSENAPHNKQEIGFGRQGASGHKVREEVISPEGYHDDKACASRYDLPPVPHVMRHGSGCGGNKPIDQSRADRRHVHDPSDCRSSDKRNQYRQTHDQVYRCRRIAPSVLFCKYGRKHPVPAHRIEQPAERRHIADKACDDKREKRQHQHHHSRAAQIVVSSIKSRQCLQSFQIAQVFDVGKPAVILRRISRHGQQRHHDVQCSGRKDSGYEQAVSPVGAKPELLCGV